MLKQAAKDIRNYLIKKAFDDAEIVTKAAELGIVAPMDEIRLGLEVELEHTEDGPMNGKYRVIGTDIDSLMRVVGAHLSERSDYYTKLKAMEEAA